MKKLLILLISISFYACTYTANLSPSQTQNNINQTDSLGLDRAHYIVGANVETQIVWIKTGPFFFLFGTNGGNEQSRREKVYRKACEENHTDGVIEPKFETERFVVPLIL